MRQLFSLIIATLFVSSFALAQEKVVAFSNFESSSPETLKFYTQNQSIILSKTAHNILLRKALLEKIGYPAPAASYLPKLKLTFKDHNEKKSFVSKIESKLNADPDRWIIEDNKEDVTLQDVILGEDLESINHDSPLIIPYAITNAPESMNILSWVSGNKFGDGVKIDGFNQDEITYKTQEISEVLLKISTLSRSDWEDIATAACLPEEVKNLLVEKLISRRNSFMELFSIDVAPMEINTDVPNVSKSIWEGYASKFASDEHESPFNPGEGFAFTVAGMSGSLLSAAVNALNDLPVFHTSAESIIQKKLIEFEKTGKTGSKPIGIWGFPFASGEFIFSREILTGGYLGDNLIELADNFGIRISLGAGFSMDGLPTAVGVGLQGQVSYSRNYTHMKPINSLRKANRFGFQNIVVPYFTRRSVQKLDPIFDESFDQLSEEEQKTVYSKALQDFKEKLPPGESIIITDSLVGSGKITGNVSLYQLIDLSAAVQDSELVISRLHIHRKDENTFQIYKDFGMANQPSFGLQLGIKNPVLNVGKQFWVNQKKDAISTTSIPIVKVKWGKNLGNTKSQYYTLNFDDGKTEIKNLEESIAQLRILKKTMLFANTETLRRHIKPHLIENQFHENNEQDRALFFSYRKLRSGSDFSVTSPNGENKKFIRSFFGRSYSFDYSDTISNLLDFGYEFFTHNKVDFGEDSTINPGYSTNGFSKNQLLEFEAEKMADGSLQNRFIKLSHVINGWKLSKNHVQKIIDQLSKDYGGNLFPETSLKETDSMFLYTIRLNINLYEKAITHLESLTETDLQILFKKYGHDLSHRRVDDRIVKRLQEFKKTRSTKAILRAISIADRILPAEGFIEFLGGKDGLVINASLDGYRRGDETVNAPILSNTIGSSGSQNIFGPLGEMRRKLGISENEFFSFWILGRIL